MQADFTDLESNRLTSDQMQKHPDIDVGRSVAVGRAAILITLRDGSDDVVATFADREYGWPINHNPDVDTVWGTAKSISRQWANDLADILSGR